MGIHGVDAVPYRTTASMLGIFLLLIAAGVWRWVADAFPSQDLLDEMQVGL